MSMNVDIPASIRPCPHREFQAYLDEQERRIAELETLIETRQLTPHVVPFTFSVGMEGVHVSTSTCAPSSLQPIANLGMHQSAMPSTTGAATTNAPAQASADAPLLPPSSLAMAQSQLSVGARRAPRPKTAHVVPSFAVAGLGVLNECNISQNAELFRKITRSDVLQENDPVWIRDTTVGFVEAHFVSMNNRTCTVRLGRNQQVVGTRAALYLRQATASAENPVIPVAGRSRGRSHISRGATSQAIPSFGPILDPLALSQRPPAEVLPDDDNDEHSQRCD